MSLEDLFDWLRFLAHVARADTFVPNTWFLVYVIFRSSAAVLWGMLNVRQLDLLCKIDAD